MTVGTGNDAARLARAAGQGPGSLRPGGSVTPGEAPTGSARPPSGPSYGDPRQGAGAEPDRRLLVSTLGRAAPPDYHCRIRWTSRLASIQRRWLAVPAWCGRRASSPSSAWYVATCPARAGRSTSKAGPFAGCGCRSNWSSYLLARAYLHPLYQGRSGARRKHFSSSKRPIWWVAIWPQSCVTAALPSLRGGLNMHWRGALLSLTRIWNGGDLWQADPRSRGSHARHSRFWPADQYRPGGGQPSFDKQFVRDWLLASRWDRNSPPPALPDEVVARTREKYVEAYERLTGCKFQGWLTLERRGVCARLDIPPPPPGEGRGEGMLSRRAITDAGFAPPSGL